MQKFEKFYFEGYSFNESNFQVEFYYSFDGIEKFTELIELDCELFKKTEYVDPGVVNNLLFHLFVSLGISYYKLYPTKELVVKYGYVDAYQKEFWKKFYINGLGEFFIKNKIDPNGLVNFVNANNSSNKIQKIEFDVGDKSLLLVGGGKDSIVSYSIIKKLEYDLFVFGKIDKIKENTALGIGKPILLITRKLSENLFRLNKVGYYNGHVPITGIIAFVTQVISYLYNYKYTILSNEMSSSECNTVWKGLKINHQYSKSIEFQVDYSEYMSRYMSSKTMYFSLLSNLYEYKISSIFSKQKEFFKIFSSCNGNFKITSGGNSFDGRWCNNCPKCVFVFLILSPFLERKELMEIFGEDLFERKDLLSLFEELVGFSNHKPFECVGTYEESFLSLYKSIGKYDKNNFPYVLEKLYYKVIEESKKMDMKKLEEKLLKVYDTNIIPMKFKSLIK